LPTRIFRRYSNRLATLNLVLLCALVGVWIPVQIQPIVASWPVLEPQIHYGTPHYARQSPLLNRVVFRMNGDDNAEFLLWMDPGNHTDFLNWFSPANPMEVWALRVSKKTWLVTDVQAAQGGLDPYAMYPFQISLAAGGIGLTLLCWIFCGFLLKEYLVHFRHRRWLAPGLPQVPPPPPGPAVPHT
jgi:hypothetical protein